MSQLHIYLGINIHPIVFNQKGLTKLHRTRPFKNNANPMKIELYSIVVKLYSTLKRWWLLRNISRLNTG